MNNTDQERFNRLLAYVRAHSNSKYTFIDEKKKAVDSVFDAVYESDNGLEEYEDGYESYQCISFKAISDGMLFEINKYHIPMKAFCDGKEINYEISDHTDKKYNLTEIPNYNKVTLDAMAEARNISRDSNAKGYSSMEELKKALED